MALRSELDRKKPNQQTADLHKALMSVLECPVCMEYMAPPIFTCDNGHNLCKGCRQQCSHCPVCRRPMAGTRNGKLEQLAASFFYPCRNAEHGCPSQLTCDLLDAHAETCEFRIYPCPARGKKQCPWKGRLATLQEHFAAVHPKQLSVVVKPDLNGLTWPISQAACFRDYFHLIRAFGEMFLYYRRFVPFKKRLFLAVQLLGPEERAAHFRYKYRMLKRPYHQVIMSAHVHSVNDSIDSLFENKQCLSVDFETIVDFGKGTRVFQIYRVDEPKKKVANVPVVHSDQPHA